MVLKVTRGQEVMVGYVVDILALDELIAELLINTALRYLLAQRVNGVLCRVLREDPVYAILCFPLGLWAFTLAIKHTPVSSTPGQS